MLTRTPASQSGANADIDTAAVRTGLSPLQAAWSCKWRILVGGVLVTAIAAVALKQLPVRYSTAASIMVDARHLQVIEARSILSSQTIDIDRVRTYLERLRSPAIARTVVDELGLADLPAFCDPGPSGGVGGLVARLLGGPPPPEPRCHMDKQDATEKLMRMVSGGNDGRSYIIKIEAEAGNPSLAAVIANAYARAYVAADRDQTNDAAIQADQWLSSYLDGMRQQMQSADAAVERYQTTNQLTPLRGETVITQRLAELNSQLVLATSQLAEKQSALHEVEWSSRVGGAIDTSAPAVQSSPLIRSLLERQSELQNSLADLSTQYGDAHPQVQAAAARLQKLRQTIYAEMSKVIAGLTEEVASLSARKASLAAAVAELQGTTGNQASANVRLQELQREADGMHRLYETMSTRLREIDAERHMSWPSSSVVVEAQPPRVPSFPRMKMMLTGIFIVSLGGGAGIAFGAGLMSKSFRDIDQVEAETGLPVLGIFPRPPRRTTAARMVVDQPNSMQAETIGFVLVNLARASVERGSGRVVLVSSAISGEGRSSFALALGQRALQSGLSVALLDCDMRSAGASRLPERTGGARRPPPPSAGRQLADPATLESGALQVLPIHSCRSDRHALAVATGAGAMVRRLRLEYDLLLIDTPAVLAVPDALALAPLVDDAILVVDMHQTPRHSVLAAAKAMRRAGIDIVGVVLSKVSLRDFARRGAGEGLYAKRGGTA
jgi:uncharacterized protein involved in exopolysaccharide biosynthesis/Mrp family chromosome partitioning ATPase